MSIGIDTSYERLDLPRFRANRPGLADHWQDMVRKMNFLFAKGGRLIASRTWSSVFGGFETSSSTYTQTNNISPDVDKDLDEMFLRGYLHRDLNYNDATRTAGVFVFGSEFTMRVTVKNVETSTFLGEIYLANQGTDDWRFESLDLDTSDVTNGSGDAELLDFDVEIASAPDGATGTAELHGVFIVEADLVEASDIGTGRMGDLCLYEDFQGSSLNTNRWAQLANDANSVDFSSGNFVDIEHIGDGSTDDWRIQPTAQQLDYCSELYAVATFDPDTDESDPSSGQASFRPRAYHASNNRPLIDAFVERGSDGLDAYVRFLDAGSGIEETSKINRVAGVKYTAAVSIYNLFDHQLMFSGGVRDFGDGTWDIDNFSDVHVEDLQNPDQKFWIRFLNQSDAQATLRLHDVYVRM